MVTPTAGQNRQIIPCSDINGFNMYIKLRDQHFVNSNLYILRRCTFIQDCKDTPADLFVPFRLDFIDRSFIFRLSVKAHALFLTFNK